MKEYLKPSEYSSQVGLHYRTVIKHFYKGFNSEIMDDSLPIVTSFCGRIYGSNRKRKTIATIVLTAINIASRNKGKKKANKVSRMKTTHTPSRPVKRRKPPKREIKEHMRKLKGDTQIAVFSPQKIKSNDDRLWSLINKVQPNSSLLITQSNKLQLVT